MPIKFASFPSFLVSVEQQVSLIAEDAKQLLWSKNAFFSLLKTIAQITSHSFLKTFKKDVQQCIHVEFSSVSFMIEQWFNEWPSRLMSPMFAHHI